MRLLITALLMTVAAAAAAAQGMTYIGCFADSKRKDLPWLAGSGPMSPARCYGLCSGLRFAYFGLQYAYQCRCGNSYGRYGRKPDSECNMKCSGDSSAFCGAGLRNSVYGTGLSALRDQVQLRECSQSSTELDGICSRAIDGNVNQVYNENSCTYTKTEKGWWQASTQMLAHIKKIRIFNRRDCCSDRLNNFVVTVDGHECATHNSSSPFLVMLLECNRVGQVVMIRNRQNTSLTLCEVQVLGEYANSTTGEQLRFDSCYQSSTARQGVCGRAMDGNTNQNYANQSCSHTNVERGFWQGSMTRKAHIKEIRIFNRLDCCSDALNNFVVTVDCQECAAYNSHEFFSMISFLCNKVGQDVVITNRQATVLTLCEVQIFGEYESSPPA